MDELIDIFSAASNKDWEKLLAHLNINRTLNNNISIKSLHPWAHDVNTITSLVLMKLLQLCMNEDNMNSYELFMDIKNTNKNSMNVN